MSVNQFLVMWDCHGLEYCHNITDTQKTLTWQTLQGTDRRDQAQVPNLLHLRLRAQMNSHRHYEIWVVGADSGVTHDDIVQMFRDNPQGAADLVRAHGECYYDGRAPCAPAIT